MNSAEHNHKTHHFKLVFIDVVRFTDEQRTMEDFVTIIEALNAIVRSVLQELGISTRKGVILIPTGDGMCIGIKNVNSYGFDIHLQAALLIRARVHEWNLKCNSVGERFLLRIAVNENEDLIIKDINNRNNIAGVGINSTARLMQLCNPGQIVVGQSVHSNTYKWKKYKERYKKVTSKDKLKIKHTYYVLGIDESFEQTPYEILGQIASKRSPPEVPNELTVHRGNTISSDVLKHAEGTLMVWASVSPTHNRVDTRRYRYIIAHSTNPVTNRKEDGSAKYANAWAILRVTPDSKDTQGRWTFWCNGAIEKRLAIFKKGPLPIGYCLFTVEWSKSDKFVRFYINSELVGAKGYAYWPDSYASSLTVGNWAKPSSVHGFQSPAGPCMTLPRVLKAKELEEIVKAGPQGLKK